MLQFSTSKIDLKTKSGVKARGRGSLVLPRPKSTVVNKKVALRFSHYSQTSVKNESDS